MSIRRRLLIWLFSALLLVSAPAALMTYFGAREEVDELFDKEMQQLALSLQNRILSNVTRTPAVKKFQDTHDVDLISQAWNSKGDLIYRSHPYPPLPYAGNPGMNTLFWRGENWRVLNLKSSNTLIQVAQLLSERRQTANEITLHLLAPFTAFIPVLALLIWIGVGRGLRPLQKIAGEVERRTPSALQPLPEDNLPREIRPLVLALNDLLGRLDDALAAQRQFIADAAHELRTPLAALSLQAQLAERARDPKGKYAALQTLRQGIARATHLVGQLMTLARIDPENAFRPFKPIRLDELARETIADYAPLAGAKNIDLGLLTTETVHVLGNPEELRTLISSLIDNAIRYTPRNGQVDINVRPEAGAVWLEIIDTGPGIPADERSRVFDRFYRGCESGHTGSGLGLAIVKRIADRHGAEIQLDSGKAGRGLRIGVQFKGIA